jgi:hypothetical protein
VFQEYLSDAEERMKSNQLKEEESVKLVDNRVQVSGVVSVMAINELLVKLIIDKNPTRQIYLEESYPLESLYSQSLPQGLIFKVNHEPLEKLPRSVVEADHRFWSNECRTLVGKVIQDEAGISELCSWTERVYLQQKPEGQGADASYLRDAVAQQYWSQCRSAIAAYYEWWGKKSEKIDSVRLTKEADFAHRQAVALSPYHPAVVWRYAQFLLKNQRTNDAKLLIETTLKTEPEKRMQIDSDQLKKAMNKLRSEAKRL